MPAVRQSMRKIREVLRLRHECGLSKRQIAPVVGIGTTTVFGCSGPANLWSGNEVHAAAPFLLPASADARPHPRASSSAPCPDLENKSSSLTDRLPATPFAGTIGAIRCLFSFCSDRDRFAAAWLTEARSNGRTRRGTR